MKLGLLAFMNDSGLGYQTRRLASMLKPDRILVVDSTPFSKNKVQHPEWYAEYETITSVGFPQNHHILKFIKGLTHILMCENPYNFYLIHACNERGIKTYIQTNYEFCENLDSPHLPLPTMFLMPSYWKIEEMKKRFGNNRVKHLPPPIDPAEFEEVFTHNAARKGKKRFLHVMGTYAAHDRNGTADLIKALPFSKGDYELVMTKQHASVATVDDPRVTIIDKNLPNPADLYRDFDALILPRRYGGLSLTVNEAMMSGLPVVMTDISPNNKLLPYYWLVPAEKKESFTARTTIECYSADPESLGKHIDRFCNFSPGHSSIARMIACASFAPDVLKEQYDTVFAS